MSSLVLFSTPAHHEVVIPRSKHQLGRRREGLTRSWIGFPKPRPSHYHRERRHLNLTKGFKGKSSQNDTQFIVGDWNEESLRRRTDRVERLLKSARYLRFPFLSGVSYQVARKGML